MGEDIQSLTVGELRKVALAEGVPVDQIEDARDSFSPKNALIELIEARRHDTLRQPPVSGDVSTPSTIRLTTSTPVARMDNPPAQVQVQHAPVPVPLPAPTTAVTVIENGLLLGNLQRPLEGVWYDISTTNIRTVDWILADRVGVHLPYGCAGVQIMGSIQLVPGPDRPCYTRRN